MAKKTAAAETKSAPTMAEMSAAFSTGAAPSGTEIPKFEKKLASKSTWVGQLTFGMVSFPVKSYKATDEDKVSLNQLHKACGNRLNQVGMKCIACDVAVSKEDIVKGFEYSKGTFIQITEEEQDAQMVGSDKQMQVTEFVPASQVDPIYFESAQYIAPDKGGEKPFALLRAGMVKNNVVGIVRRTERGREHTMVIRPYGKNGMTVHYMAFEHEVRAMDKWVDVALNEKELAMASMLIEALTDDFKPETKFDSYTVNMRALIEAKATGKSAPNVAKAPVPAATDDLMAALEASLNASKAKNAARKSA